MNLVYFIPDLSKAGGMERVLTQKVNYLAHTGLYNISIITTEMLDNDKPFFELHPDIKIHRFKIFFNDIYDLNIIKKTKKMYKKLYIYKGHVNTFLKENNVDILISMGGKELEFLYTLKGPFKKVYEAHFSNGIRTRNLIDKKGNSFFWRLVAKFREFQIVKQTQKLDALIVLTEQSKKDWLRTNNNVTVISNPSAIKTLPNCYDSKSTRVITLGRLEYEKGFDLLIKAWTTVVKKYPNWKLDIFGTGSLEESLNKLIVELKLSNSVKLRGVTKNVSQELLKSSFYVLPSRYEGLPLVMLECLSCGLPMVAFDCETGPADIIENNDCGFLVKNGDTDHLSKNIIYMIESTSQRVMQSINCTNKSDNYAVDNIMKIWQNLFKKLMTKDSI